MFLESPSSKKDESVPLRKYTYRDNLDGKKIVFECEANGILEADEKYTAATGRNSTKEPHIGISFKNVTE